MKSSNHNQYNKFLEEGGNIFHSLNEVVSNYYEDSPKI